MSMVLVEQGQMSTSRSSNVSTFTYTDTDGNLVGTMSCIDIHQEIYTMYTQLPLTMI